MIIIKRLFLIISGLILIISLSSCKNNKKVTNTISLNTNDIPKDTTNTNDISKDTTSNIGDDYMDKILCLKIGNEELDINWLDNNSVSDLKKLSKDTLIINMHEYGGFEQTGMIGKTIRSNDSEINVIPGDIVLYNSNQISIFYNNSKWSYTKLGHINLSNEKLNNLLNVANVTVTFYLK